MEIIDIILNINAMIIISLWLYKSNRDEDNIPLGVLLYLYLGTFITAGLIISNLFKSCISVMINP